MNILTIYDGDTDEARGAFLILSPEELSNVANHNVESAEMENGFHFVIGCEEDTTEWEEVIATNDPRTVFDYLDRGEDGESPLQPSRFAMCREDYEGRTTRFNKMPAVVNVIIASGIEVSTQVNPECIAIGLAVPSVDAEVNYEIRTKQEADDVIAHLIAARNIKWPTP